MSEVISTEPTTSHRASTPSPETSVEVFAVYGVEPEIQAYAMAKYSRSALSMKESLKEITAQRAEKFLNTFYFQYGHRSIADLAHIALAIERLSILAAIVVADEQRWDGQERSTRYQDFKRGGYFVPDFSGLEMCELRYRDTIAMLFGEYEALSEQMWRHLAKQTPRPAEMKPEMYERTLRARAFDISRYLLPMATNTSLGQIVNARTLESQIARLLSHTHPEVRHLGELLKRAANEPAYDVNEMRYRELIEDAKAYDDMWAKQLREDILKQVRVAPTLVKYAEANPYQMETRRELKQAAAEIMGHAPVAEARPVELLEDDALEMELATTLLYEHCHYPYRQIRERVEALGERRRQEIVELGVKHRGKHDELLRAFNAGQGFRFDILMDIGGYRDMHRHRRCTQIGQEFTTRHGFDTPDEVRAAGVVETYAEAMQRAAVAVEGVAAEMRRDGRDDAEASTQYLIPLGFRKRTLFKMDFAEAVYIADLRTGPGGHMSYRRVAYQMYEAVAKRHPSLAKLFRVHDVNEPVDLLKR
jgi:thymidylate synthase ThyX